MKNKIIFASNNESKLKEHREVLSKYGIEVISQRDAGVDMDIEESGTTYIANARIKANTIYSILHKAVFADDSGIEVDALNGEPGVYSHRYAKDGQHCAKMLNDLKDVPDENRGARYVTHVHYINEDGAHYDFEETCEGKITTEERGEKGFIFDRIFEVSTGKMYSEMSLSEKNAISARGKAARKMANVIKPVKSIN